MAARKPPRPTEAEVLRGVMQVLQVNGVWAMRLNSGAQAIPAAHGQARRFVRFGQVGASDVFGVLPGHGSHPAGRALFAETKRPGERLRPEQLAWLLARQSEGAVSVWTDDVRGFGITLRHVLGGGRAVLGDDGLIDLV